MKIRKFKDRKPSLPSKWAGVELQFYVRCEAEDEIEKQLYAYEEYTLPWREEFGIETVYEGEEVVVEGFDYRIANEAGYYESLLAEAKG